MIVGRFRSRRLAPGAELAEPLVAAAQMIMAVQFPNFLFQFRKGPFDHRVRHDVLDGVAADGAWRNAECFKPLVQLARRSRINDPASAYPAVGSGAHGAMLTEV